MTKPVCLFLKCVPRSKAPLDIEGEINATGLQHGDHALRLARVTETQVDQLVDSIAENDPVILHFSGHGGDRSAAGDHGEGTLFFEDSSQKPVALTAEILADLIEGRATKLAVVVLNACDSKDFAEEFMRRRDSVQFVVGTSAAISDDEAAGFSRQFYQALNRGETIAAAFRKGQARARVDASRLSANYILREKVRGEAARFSIVQRTRKPNRRDDKIPPIIPLLCVAAFISVLLLLAYYPPAGTEVARLTAILVGGLAAGTAAGTLVHGRLGVAGTISGVTIDATSGLAAAVLAGWVGMQVPHPPNPDPGGPGPGGAGGSGGTLGGGGAGGTGAAGGRGGAGGTGASGGTGGTGGFGGSGGAGGSGGSGGHGGAGGGGGHGGTRSGCGGSTGFPPCARYLSPKPKCCQGNTVMDPEG